MEERSFHDVTLLEGEERSKHVSSKDERKEESSRARAKGRKEDERCCSSPDVCFFSDGLMLVYVSITC